MIEVTGDDGRVHSFADGTSQAQIDAALDAMYGVPPQRAYVPPPQSGRQAQGRSSTQISQVQMLVGGLVGLALLAGVGFMITREKPAPAIAQTPIAPVTQDAATVVPLDPALAVTPAGPAGPNVVSEAFAGFVATRQGGNVTVRAQPAPTGTQIAQLPHGAPVSVTGSVTTPDGLWRQVSVGGATGFIKGEYISQTQPAAIAKAPAPPAAKMIPREFWAFASTKTDSSVNVRSSPSATAAVTSSIPTGDSVYVVGEQGSWYLVEWQGKRGWASRSYITKEDRD